MCLLGKQINMNLLRCGVSAKLNSYLSVKQIDGLVWNTDFSDAVKNKVMQLVCDAESHDDIIESLERLFPQEYTDMYDNFSEVVSNDELKAIENFATLLWQQTFIEINDQRIPSVILVWLLESAARKKRRCNAIEERQKTF